MQKAQYKRNVERVLEGGARVGMADFLPGGGLSSPWKEEEVSRPPKIPACVALQQATTSVRPCYTCSSLENQGFVFKQRTFAGLPSDLTEEVLCSQWAKEVSYRHCLVRPAWTKANREMLTSKPRVLMCTTNHHDVKDNPPPGLCDIVVYDTRGADLSSQGQTNIQKFMDFCKTGQTACGLNIVDPIGVLYQLYADATKVMQDLYAAGIKNYGLLRSEITTSSKVEDFKYRVVDLLKKLETFMTVTGDPRDTLFWAVSPLLEGATTVPESMLQVFLNNLKSASINMVVYQTTYEKIADYTDPNCLSTGPALWSSAPFPKQPTFVDALNFRKAVMKVQQDPSIMEMLAIMLCGYWTKFGKNTAKAEFGVKDNCDGTRVDKLENYVCVGESTTTRYLEPGTVVSDAQMYVAMTAKKDWTVGYDMNDTILQKICMASLEYGYDGGWVVHGLQCHLRQHCTAFPRVRVVNDSMRHGFTRCEYTG